MRALTHEQLGLVARRARALSDPTRVRIIEVLARGPQPVGKIAAALTSQPSTVSRHLQVLFVAGLVDRRREASTVVYSLATDDLLAWCRALASPRLTSIPSGALIRRV
jgi:DNA-binding transcriptional ArsR family regulator